MAKPLCPKVTVFGDLSGSRAKLVDFDAESMVLHPETYKYKKDMPLLRFARFGSKTTEKGSLRHDQNILEATGLELDYDTEELAYEAAVKLLRTSGIESYVHTSPSWTLDTPRWRVLAPFSTPVSVDIRLHRLGCVGLTEHILGVKFNSDTTKITQSYFFGQIENGGYQACYIPGIPIDQHLDLPFFIQVAKDVDREVMDQEQKIKDLVTGENITESAMSLIGKQVQAGMTREFIITTMTAMIETAEGRSSSTLKQRIKDLPRQVDNIIRLHRRNNPGDTPEHRPEKPAEGLQFQAWSDIVESKVPDQVIEDVLTVNASSMIIADYNVGKSALLLDMCVCVAAGENWAGKRVKQGPCIYMAAEGTGSIRNRILAYRKEYPDLELYVLPQGGWTLADTKGRTYVEGEVLKLARSKGWKYVAVVAIDTMAEAAPGIDENSPVMGDIISWSKQLGNKVHGNVVTNHHKAKHSDGSRGHTSAPAASDTLIQLTEKDGVVTAKVTKQRDLGSRGQGVQFKIIGHDTGQVSNFGTPVLVARVEYLTGFGHVNEEAEAPMLPSGKLERDIMRHLEDGPFTGTWVALCEAAWKGEEPVPSLSTTKRVKENLIATEQLSVKGTNRQAIFTRIDVDLNIL